MLVEHPVEAGLGFRVGIGNAFGLQLGDELLAQFKVFYFRQGEFDSAAEGCAYGTVMIGQQSQSGFAGVIESERNRV